MLQLIESSVFCNFIRRVLSGSKAIVCLVIGSKWLIMLLSALGCGTARVVHGSRFIGLFKVGNYLDFDQTSVWRVYGINRMDRSFFSFIDRVSQRGVRLWAALAWRRSIGLRGLNRAYSFLETGLSRKNMLLLSLAFLAGFFLVQQTIMSLIPAAKLSFPWSGGFCLSLLLLLVLFNLKSHNYAQDEEIKIPGLAQRIARMTFLLVCKVSMPVKHLRVICRKIIFGSTPPVEGREL
jgi:hypothetical protein